MGDDKSPLSLSPMGSRDRELLIPVSGGGSAPGDGNEDGDRTASSSASAALSSSSREAFHKVVRSWASKKFMTGWFKYRKKAKKRQTAELGSKREVWGRAPQRSTKGCSPTVNSNSYAYITTDRVSAKRRDVASFR